MSERLFLPLVDLIQRQGGKIVGGQLVSGANVDEVTGNVSTVVTRDKQGAETSYAADAVIFAVGITGESSHCLGSCGSAQRSQRSMLNRLRKQLNQEAACLSVHRHDSAPNMP